MAGTTTDKLERLMQTKADIKSALIEKGQAPGDVFSEYADMVRAISGGGGGGSGDGSAFIINGPEVSIASEVSVLVENYEQPKTHALYNGVRLPIIPEDVRSAHTYFWIRKNKSAGYYDLVCSHLQPWYSASSGIAYATLEGECTWYRVSIADSENATVWTFKETLTAYFGLDANRTVLWSSHDIPNGSVSATNIYFEGTEPVPTN